MNILLFDNSELNDGLLTLADRRAKHIIKVLHCDCGDHIRIGEINGKVGTGTVVLIKKKFPFRVDLFVDLSDQPVPSPPVDLVLAMPRPIMLKRILSQVTALGIGTIYLINAERVEKSFWNAGILTEEEYVPHLIQGLEQAVDTRLPQIRIFRYFTFFVEEVLPGIAAHYSSLVIAHPSSEKSLLECLSGKRGRILYAVGPEGGWLEPELEKFLAAGMNSFSMGARILKVDTAVVTIHGRISQILDDTS